MKCCERRSNESLPSNGGAVGHLAVPHGREPSVIMGTELEVAVLIDTQEILHNRYLQIA